MWTGYAHPSETVTEYDLATRLASQHRFELADERVIHRQRARARHIGHVYYLAAPAAGRAVSRAVGEARARDRITVLELADTRGIVQAEQREGMGHARV